MSLHKIQFKNIFSKVPQTGLEVRFTGIWDIHSWNRQSEGDFGDATGSPKPPVVYIFTVIYDWI